MYLTPKLISLGNMGSTAAMVITLSLVFSCTSNSIPTSGSSGDDVPNTSLMSATVTYLIEPPTASFRDETTPTSFDVLGSTTLAEVLATPRFPSSRPALLDLEPTLRGTKTSPLTLTPTNTQIPVLESTVVSSDEKINSPPPPPDRDLLELARSLVLKTKEPISREVSGPSVVYQAGRVDSFFVTDLADKRVFTTEASLRLVSPHAYWYVEDGVKISQRRLEESAEVFENEIYPGVVANFGAEWSPGIDKDVHLTILHARLRGVAGYFSSADEYPSSVFAFSNQREMIYLNASSLLVGSPEYLAVLAHELQHAVHWNGDSTEETWVNEGLAELAAKLLGYQPSSQNVFLGNPTISLTNWPDQPSVSHYGADFLFFDYLFARLGSQQDLRLLVEDQADGIAGIDSYLKRIGSKVTFDDVFKDWVIANLLDEPGDGPYSYPDNEVNLRNIEDLNPGNNVQSSIPQYSAEYFSIDGTGLDLTIRFEGQRKSSLLPVQLLGDSCWWGNRGDSISSSLTRHFDLTLVDDATLTFQAWYDIEEDWDFGYLQISTDGGSTWDVIDAPGTSSEDRLGNSFGPGYTGNSGGWKLVEVDLADYTGRNLLVRFNYVTDEALHNTGICIDQIAVPQIGFLDDGSSDAGWDSQGFRRTDNLVSQGYAVQVVEVGETNIVRDLQIGEDNAGRLTLLGNADTKRLVVVVAALAPDTRQAASYRLFVDLSQ